MLNIKLKHPSLNKDWSMQFMDESNYDELYDEDVAIYKPGGDPLLILRKKAIDPQVAANAWREIKTINAKNKNRAVATGIEASYYKKEDGSLSKVTMVPKNWAVMSDIIGYFDRSSRLPYARPCAWNAHHPDKFQRIIPMFQQTSKIFEKEVPDRYQNQKDFCKITDPAWVIPETVYTTVTVNKNFRTAAHKDAGDLREGFSNMIVIKEGASTGGHLVLPDWRVAVKLDSLDLVMFDAHEFHGNTKIINLTKKSVRCSLVMYFRERLSVCKDPKTELLRAKNKKPGEAIYSDLEE